MYIINPFRFGVAVDVYADATAIWSLRKFYGWSNAVLRIRRSSDDALAYVFFDGSSSSELITTSSFISTTSDTTPSATILSTWIGSDNGFVFYWYGQTSDNIIDTAFRVVQNTNGTQPQIITSGTIITKGSLPAIDFLSTSTLLGQTTPLTVLNAGNEWTMFTVASAVTLNERKCIWSNRTGASFDGFVCFNELTTLKRMMNLIASGTNFAVDYISQQNTLDQKLTTFLVTTSDGIAYHNGILQATVAFTGTTANNTFSIGHDRNAAVDYTGTMQEFVLFPSDKTSDQAAIHANINAYYSIY